MDLRSWFDQASGQSEANGTGVIAGAPHAFGLAVTRDAWRQCAESMAENRGRLLALWGGSDGIGGNVVRAAFIADLGVLVLSLRMRAAQDGFPGIEQLFPSAGRMQRAVMDLCGFPTTDSDTRPWLRHNAWPA